jgi:photosynthetic reaction center cytochrome c subunit
MNSSKLFTRCLIASCLLILGACERPPVESSQTGYRGTGMADIQNPRDPKSTDSYPAALDPVPAAGPRAGDAYENVQVLGDLTIPEFTRFMTAITQWVSPEEGCNYCHVVENLASDDVYTKVVSRRMIEMTQAINREWSAHVGQTGVNCYTCHRGNVVPGYVWFETAKAQSKMATYAGNRAGQNAPATEVGLASLPVDPFSTLLISNETPSVRVVSRDAFPGKTNGASIQMTETTYALMMHISSSLDANCTYCHNSASFQSWQGSTPQRVTAYQGIEMVQALNGEYIVPLTGEFPAERLGPLGDAPKANCATCHQGQKKPLGGAPAVAAYPTLAAD